MGINRTRPANIAKPQRHLLFRARKGDDIPIMNPKHQVPSTEDFLRTRPVFTLGEFAAALGPDRRRVARERLKYHAGQGRVKLLERGLYASVPAGIDADRHRADAHLEGIAPVLLPCREELVVVQQVPEYELVDVAGVGDNVRLDAD